VFCPSYLIEEEKMSESMAVRQSEVPWWIVLLWGIATIVVGVLLLTQPAITALVWVQFMAIYWLIGGVFDAVGAVIARQGHWGWRLLGGILGIIAGLVVIGHPFFGVTVTLQVLFVFLAVSAIFSGVISIWIGFSERWAWGPLLLGIVQFIIGVWLLMHPIAGMLALIPMLAIFAIVGGIAAVILAFRLR
jgi:uncharacterized membrane protein HdeD (DUF308 family)